MWSLSAALLPLAIALVTPETPACVSDADGDGICDRVEDRTGTDRLDADTDGDGVPDGVEDANRDGRVSPGESDPRVPGLFPGSYPHIPEPMVFDLVRGLGARKGEVEVNTLLVTRFSRRGTQIAWAPEVEWALADNLAVEFELPMVARQLEALKVAGQVTLPEGTEQFIHGVQVIGEYLLTPREIELTALYLAGYRVQAASFFAMVGLRGVTPLAQAGHVEALVNPSVYFDLSERFTVGVETNVAIGFDGHTSVLAVPQLHYQISRHLRIQLGGGVAFEDGERRPGLATRLILE